MALLGILDEPVRFPEQCTHRDNLIGGPPVFPENFDPSGFSDLINECDHCRKPLSFLLQLYCPVDQSSDDRCLYLFVCIKCSEPSTRLIRLVIKSETNEKKDEPLFQDDWADPQSLASDFGERLNLEKNNEKFDLDQFRKFPPHYLAVIEEPDQPPNIETKTVSIEPEIDANEKYEKNYPEAFGKDKNNYKFYKTLQRCPEQILRYQWHGTALYPTDKDKKFEPKRCQNCGSPRIFEFQLMPGLINFLGTESELEFETIMAFTCSRNCTTKQQFCYEHTILFKENFPTSAGDRLK